MWLFQTAIYAARYFFFAGIFGFAFGIVHDVFVRNTIVSASAGIIFLAAAKHCNSNYKSELNNILHRILKFNISCDGLLQRYKSFCTLNPRDLLDFVVQNAPQVLGISTN